MVKNCQIVGYKEFESFLNTYVKDKDIKVGILDDIDCDGFISAFITKEYVQNLLGSSGLVSIVHNFTHGLNTKIAKILEIYDIIIVVDSSTNEYMFVNENQPTLIIDHHNRTPESKTLGINPNQVCTSLNSKDTEELKNISAGMFSYLLFSKYFENYNLPSNDEELFRTACISIYSDIIPVDDTVEILLDRFLDYTPKSDTSPESQIIRVLNQFSNPINKTLLSYTVIPLINYSRKADKLNLLDELTNSMNNTSTENYWCYNGLTKNRSFVKAILEEISPITPYKQYENFIVKDITKYLGFKDCPVENFKGLIANQSLLKNNHVSITGFTNELDDKLFTFSCRSKQFPIQEFMKPYTVEGGGHDLACGFTAEKKILANVFRELERELKYYKPAEKDMVIKSPSEIDLNDLYRFARYNEIAFSNLNPKVYRIDNSKSVPYHIEGKGKYTFSLRGWDDLKFTGFTIPEIGQSIRITPTFISKDNYELMVEPVQ